MQTALLGMQLYGEMTYMDNCSEEHLNARFKRCCNCDAQAFLDLSLLNTVPGMTSYPNNPTNACKIYLYQDPLVQLFEKDMEGFEAVRYFEELELKYARYAQENPAFGLLFDFYTALAHALALKCRWHDEAASAVRNGDREKAAVLAADLPATIEAVQTLRSVWRKLWESTNKPFALRI